MELFSDEGCSLILTSSRNCSSPAGWTDRQTVHWGRAGQRREILTTSLKLIHFCSI